MNEHKELNRAVPGCEVNSPWLPASGDAKSWVTAKFWDTWWVQSEIGEQAGRQKGDRATTKKDSGQTESLSETEATLCKWTNRVESKLLSLLPDSNSIMACKNIHCAVMFGWELGSCSLFALSHTHAYIHTIEKRAKWHEVETGLTCWCFYKV